MTEPLKRAFDLAQHLSEDNRSVIGQLLPEKIQAFEALEQYSHDLTALARQGEFAPLLRREGEIERVFQILARRLKNSPALIGEPGGERIGIVTELARRVSVGDVPETVKIRRIIALDVEALIAGTTYRGEFEERLKAVIEAIQQPEGQTLLFIDDLPRLVGAAEQNSVDVANILVPSLSRGQLQIIGTSTLSDYRKYVERDLALQRRFQEVVIRD